MNVILEVDKKSWSKVEQTFNNIISGVVSAEQPLRESANIVKDQAKQNFNDQGYTYGKAWKPLAQSTRKQRARLGFSPARPILVRTGQLRDRVRVESVTKNEAIVKNPVSYAIYHQTGTRNMPQRIVLTVTEKIRKAIQLVFVNYIARLISK